MLPKEKTKFFNQLAIAMNISDLNMAHNFYYAYIKMIARSLKKCGKIESPDLGVFYMKEREGREIGMINTKVKTRINSVNVLKFDVDYKLKAFVKNL